MAESEMDAQLAAALKRSVEEKDSEEEQLSRALEESLAIQPSGGQEDPLLARALHESKQDVERQQAAILAEYERARKSAPGIEAHDVGSGGKEVDSGCDPSIAAAVEASRESFHEQQARILAEYERLRNEWQQTQRPTLAAEDDSSATSEVVHAVSSSRSMDARRRVYVGSLTSDRPMTRGEKVALAMDYGGNLDAASPAPPPPDQPPRASSSARGGSSSAARRRTGQRPRTSSSARGGSSSAARRGTDPALIRRSVLELGANGAVSGDLSEKKRGRMVVIDGQNVACEMGGGRNSFSSKGIEIALDFYQERGFHAVAIVPRHRIETRGQNDRNVADDVPLLLSLRKSGRVFFSPESCHDDYFILQYAIEHEAFVISNDRFREMPGLQNERANMRRVAAFIENMRVPFMFVDGQFIPSPAPAQLGMR